MPTSFPRSYHVLGDLSTWLNVGSMICCVALAVFDVKVEWWGWLLIIAPPWLAYGAWRVVARAHFRRLEKEAAECIAAIERILREAGR